MWADFINVAGNLFLFFLALRLFQSHYGLNNDMGKALAFLFH